MSRSHDHQPIVVVRQQRQRTNQPSGVAQPASSLGGGAVRSGNSPLLLLLLLLSLGPHGLLLAVDLSSPIRSLSAGGVGDRGTMARPTSGWLAGWLRLTAAAETGELAGFRLARSSSALHCHPEEQRRREDKAHND